MKIDVPGKKIGVCGTGGAAGWSACCCLLSADGLLVGLNWSCGKHADFFSIT